MNPTSIYKLFFLLLISLQLSCQSKKTLSKVSEKTKSVNYLYKGKFSDIERDGLGYTYLVTESNELIKLDKDYRPIFTYSATGLGDIRSVNVINPQKLALYYSDYNNLVFLDNTLSEIKRLDVEALDIWDIQGAVVARDNFIWLFDQSNIRLIKISESGQVFLNSNEQDPELRPFLNSYPDMIAKENVIYIYDEERLVSYDEFGVHLATYPISAEDMQVAGDRIFFISDNSLRCYTTEVTIDDPDEKLFELPEGVVAFRAIKEGVLVVDGGGLHLLKG